MPDWGEIFADPEMQRLPPNPEVMALVPELRAGGVQQVLDAGCGAGRHLVPLAAAGFQVLGVDREWGVLRDLRRRPGRQGLQPGWSRPTSRACRLPGAASTLP